MTHSFGEAVVLFIPAMAIAGCLAALLRRDIYDPNDTPDFEDLKNALTKSQPLRSQWKDVDEDNRLGYAIQGFCFIILSASFWFGDLLTDAINRL